MCFEPTAIPPQLPTEIDRVTRIDTNEAVLSASETPFRAFLSSPAEARAPAVVVLPDVRGLCRYYELLTTRLAEAGYPALAIDYFGRTAGTARRDDDFDFMPHIRATTTGQLQDDIASAIRHLHTTTDATSYVTMGFCFGGAHSMLASAKHDLGLAGAIAFYPGLDATRLGVYSAPESRAAGMNGPLLGIFGGADPAIPESLISSFDRALSTHQVDHEFVTYPGAPHSFFDRTQSEHANECEDSWRRVLAFLSKTGTAQ